MKSLLEVYKNKRNKSLKHKFIIDRLFDLILDANKDEVVKYTYAFYDVKADLFESYLEKASFDSFSHPSFFKNIEVKILIYLRDH